MTNITSTTPRQMTCTTPLPFLDLHKIDAADEAASAAKRARRVSIVSDFTSVEIEKAEPMSHKFSDAASDCPTRCSSKVSWASSFDFSFEEQNYAIHNTFVCVQVSDDDAPRLEHRTVSAPATPTGLSLDSYLSDANLLASESEEDSEPDSSTQVKFVDQEYTIKNTFICAEVVGEEQPKLEHRTVSAPVYLSANSPLSNATVLGSESENCSRDTSFEVLASADAQTPSDMSASSDHSNAGLSSDETNTTIIIKFLPADWKQSVLITLLVQQGFHGRFNFVYMPMNYRTGLNVGYAFVNLQDHSTALDLMQKLEEDVGFGKGGLLKPKGLKTEWGSCQGLAANIERFRNSSVMHSVVPPECKPALYDQDGNAVSFPPPTEHIRKPRIHMSANDHASQDDEIVVAIASQYRNLNRRGDVAVASVDAGGEQKLERPKRKGGRGAGKK